MVVRKKQYVGEDWEFTRSIAIPEEDWPRYTTAKRSGGWR
jgi:hypothetical protein